MRRSDICLYLGPADRAEIQALITNRNTSRKLVWRSGIVLATADGQGTFEIMRRAHVYSSVDDLVHRHGFRWAPDLIRH